jgi:multicomponent Na+:H+ antiporter subunit E
MKSLACSLLALGLWVLLSLPFGWGTFALGVVAAAAVGTAMARIFPVAIPKWIDLRRWFFAAVYVPYFLYYCVKANLDVAMRVLHPDMPIRPGIVKVTTGLTSEMAKTFLANSISLTPGTLTMDVDGQDVYVHWINIHTDDPALRQHLIVGRYEGLLKRIFE